LFSISTVKAINIIPSVLAEREEDDGLVACTATQNESQVNNLLVTKDDEEKSLASAKKITFDKVDSNRAGSSNSHKKLSADAKNKTSYETLEIQTPSVGGHGQKADFSHGGPAKSKNKKKDEKEQYVRKTQLNSKGAFESNVAPNSTKQWDTIEDDDVKNDSTGGGSDVTAGEIEQEMTSPRTRNKHAPDVNTGSRAFLKMTSTHPSKFIRKLKSKNGQIFHKNHRKIQKDKNVMTAVAGNIQEDDKIRKESSTFPSKFISKLKNKNKVLITIRKSNKKNKQQKKEKLARKQFKAQHHYSS
jgi:hypothetical protein